MTGSDRAVKTRPKSWLSEAAEHRTGLNELNSWVYVHAHTHTGAYSLLMVWGYYQVKRSQEKVMEETIFAMQDYVNSQCVNDVSHVYLPL